MSSRPMRSCAGKGKKKKRRGRERNWEGEWEKEKGKRDRRNGKVREELKWREQRGEERGERRKGKGRKKRKITSCFTVRKMGLPTHGLESKDHGLIQYFPFN